VSLTWDETLQCWLLMALPGLTEEVRKRKKDVSVSFFLFVVLASALTFRWMAAGYAREVIWCCIQTLLTNAPKCWLLMSLPGLTEEVRKGMKYVL
jgi:hypothetical protein